MTICDMVMTVAPNILCHWSLIENSNQFLKIIHMCFAWIKKKKTIQYILLSTYHDLKKKF